MKINFFLWEIFFFFFYERNEMKYDEIFVVLRLLIELYMKLY